MRKTLTLLLAGAALSALGAAAVAQPYRGPDRQPPSATFYELPDFRGRSVTLSGDTRNLTSLGFNDRAMSARFTGEWEVCEDAEYRGRCEDLEGQVRDLTTQRMDRRISSARVDDRGRPGGGRPDRRPDTATLYEFPNYMGRSVTIERDSADLNTAGFNDKAMSARFEGEWRACTDANYRGRCETFSGEVPNLFLTPVSRNISSLQSLRDDDGPGRPGGGGGGPWGRNEGVEGANVVFYARPRMNDIDLWGSGKATADDFCRRMGHVSAVYFDVTQRSRRSQDFNGRSYDNGTILRDVLCRK